jgi:hypothetical protein
VPAIVGPKYMPRFKLLCIFYNQKNDYQTIRGYRTAKDGHTLPLFEIKINVNNQKLHLFEHLFHKPKSRFSLFLH